jgi:REP element-mobilizing transposase RayT
MIFMSRPPRLDVIFERNREITYLVTWCVAGRKPVLNNLLFFKALRLAIKQANRWHVECGVVMPDHVHLLASPFHRDEAVSTLVHFLKRQSRAGGHGDWKWQPGCFDHLLRSRESAQQKWTYIRENPVRAGLVNQWRDWPYRIGFKEKNM